MPKNLGFFCLLLLASMASGSLQASPFGSDCTQLMKALVDAEKSELIAKKMLDPVEGKTETFLSAQAVPWVGYYFPFEKGGIAARWQRPSSEHIPEKLISEDVAGGDEGVKQALAQMSREEINKLSPAEKMDIYMGFYDFRITRRELEARGPRRPLKPQYWEGFCNGRCAAGMLTQEPTHPVKVKNSDGIEVSFEPNDIKALLTASYFYVEDYAQMGVPNRLAEGDLEERVNPAAFDMALRSMIGEAERPFVVDIEAGPEVWNYLAVGYTRKLDAAKPIESPIEGAPTAAVSQIEALTRVYYVNDIQSIARHNEPTTNLVKKDNYLHTFSRTYPYTLYLDSEGKIVGGRWKNNKDLPDFAWFPVGRGTDAEQGTNPHLSFDTVLELQQKSTGRRSWFSGLMR